MSARELRGVAVVAASLAVVGVAVISQLGVPALTAGLRSHPAAAQPTAAPPAPPRTRTTAPAASIQVVPMLSMDIESASLSPGALRLVNVLVRAGVLLRRVHCEDDGCRGMQLYDGRGGMLYAMVAADGAPAPTCAQLRAHPPQWFTAAPGNDASKTLLAATGQGAAVETIDIQIWDLIKDSFPERC